MKTALWMVALVGLFGPAFAQESEPSAPEPPEGFAEVMVLGSSFDVVTGDVALTVMDWTAQDERRGEKARKTRDVVVALAALVVVERDGQWQYDTAEIVAADGLRCTSAKLWVARKVDLDFWEKRLASWRTIWQFRPPCGPRKNFVVEEVAPFAKIDNYPSEEFVVISELMGQDKATGEMIYKRREVRRDGLDVGIRTDGAFWLSAEYSGKEEAPPTVGARYTRATILLPFESRHQVTEWRKMFSRFQDARDMYLIEHPQK